MRDHSANSNSANDINFLIIKSHCNNSQAVDDINF